jgi:hypothetical protein
MLEVVTDYSEIQKAQQQFEQAFDTLWDKDIDGYVSYRGERRKTTLRWSSELKLWGMLGKVENSRYWNAFGLKIPRENSSNHIVSEINIPLEGINRRIGGIFAQDDEKNVFICHRGKIGGGRQGIGKTLFENNFRGDRWVIVKDGKRESKVALIERINSPRLPYQIRDFVVEVDRIKKIVTKDIGNVVPKNDLGFSPEFSGEKHLELHKHVVSRCDHGFVVSALAKFLESQGLNIGNDQYRDLFVLNHAGDISRLYEVKTDLSLYNLYTGVGQLLLNSSELVNKPELVLVLPEEPEKDLRTRLQRIGIDIFIYRLTEKDVIFLNTEE